MNRDASIEIRRAANGYIVTKPFNPARGPEYAYEADIYVFETFEALTTWLDEHFTKPGENSNE